MSTFRHSFAAGIVLLLPQSGSAQDAVPSVVASCVSCHSADGNPLVIGVPILSGQRRAYLENALLSYRDGRRKGGGADVMAAYAKGLTDIEIKEIVEWFGKN